MVITIGNHEFDRVDYDADADVLYLNKGEPQSADETLASPQGHAVRLDDAGEVIGMSIVNARWLIDRDGEIVVTVPERIVATRGELADALSVSG